MKAMFLCTDRAQCLEAAIIPFGWLRKSSGHLQDELSVNLLLVDERGSFSHKCSNTPIPGP